MPLEKIFSKYDHMEIRGIGSVMVEDKVTIHSAIFKNIGVGTTIYTDDHRGYKDIGGDYYQHESV